MRKTTLLLGLAFAATTLSGCDDDATKVCKKMAEIVKNDKELPEEAKKEAGDIEKCVTEAKKEQEKNPEAFKKQADCVMGKSDMKGVMECMAEAAKEEAKKDEEKKE
jgi:hypothetical protein